MVKKKRLALSNLTNVVDFRDRVLPKVIRSRFAAGKNGCLFEYYANTPGACFDLPAHTTHWLLVQETGYPEKLEMEHAGMGHNVAKGSDADCFIFIPAGQATAWNFTRVNGCAHLLIEDEWWLQALQSEKMPSELLGMMAPMVGQKDTKLCQGVRQFARALRSGLQMDVLAYETTLMHICMRVLKLQQRTFEWISTGYGNTDVFVGGFVRPRIAYICEYIRRHLADKNLSLAVMADEIGMNRYQFSRFFKEHTGVSPWYYVMNARASRARGYLSSRGCVLTGEQIATLCGFADHPHLTRIFKRFYAFTPSQWKMMHQC